jgi:transmembrane sensor
MAPKEAGAAIAAEAEEWLETIRNSCNPRDHAEFLQWLKASPENVRDTLCADAWDKLLDRCLDPDRSIDIDELARRAAVNVVPLGCNVNLETTTAAVPVRLRNTQGKRVGRSWLVALGTAVCMVIAPALHRPQVIDHVDPQQQFHTAIGEQRSAELADGSIVHLNTRSRVSVAFSADARDIYLLDGQAIFAVKHDTKRPFRVHVGSAVVQAIGTQFDVRRLGNRASVAVIEGVVKIISAATGDVVPETVSKLPAGESVVIAADGKVVSHAAISPEDASAWRQRRLIFYRQTLEAVAAEFNRYNRTPQIRIVGEALRARRYTIKVDAADVEAFVALVATDNAVDIEHIGNELIIRERSSLAQTPE